MRQSRPSGAAGIIAAEYVARQPNDGNTLLMTNISNHAIAPSLHPKLSYDADRDFTALMLVGVTPNLLIGNKDQKANTLADLVALCKQDPGAVSFGSSGIGAAQHLALELFKLQAHVW